jgi:excisionase family DNA binding protein
MSSISSTAAPDTKMPRSRKQVLPQKWDGRVVFNVEELAEILRTNTWTIYEAIKRKEISVVRIGRVIRIARPVVEEMLAG